MSVHIDTNDPRYKQAAAEILRRHDKGEPEANITSAVRNFLTVTGLVKGEEIVEENPPAEGSRRAVDLAALDTFIEFKRRIGTASGFNPDPRNVDQLDDYLAQSQKQGRVRMGILTDGKYWLLRWPNAGPARTVPTIRLHAGRIPTAGSSCTNGAAGPRPNPQYAKPPSEPHLFSSNRPFTVILERSEEPPARYPTPPSPPRPPHPSYRRRPVPRGQGGASPDHLPRESERPNHPSIVVPAKERHPASQYGTGTQLLAWMNTRLGCGRQRNEEKRPRPVLGVTHRR